MGINLTEKIRRYRHLSCLHIKAVFSTCGNYRYLLEIEKNSSKIGTQLCVIMQNPSTADESYADKSVQFLEKLIFEKETKLMHTSKMLIVNQFAYIQTKDFKGLEQQIGPLNDAHIKRAILNADQVLLAWGKTNPFHDRQELIFGLLSKFPEKEVFVTKCHPSRGHYKNFIAPWQT